MKKIILILILFVNYSYGQEVKEKTYKFLNPMMVKNINQYEKAFSTADMSSFRFKDKSNVIEFESGLKVEIFSGQKLFSEGFQVDFSKLMSENTLKNKNYVFSISNDGKYILRKFTKTEFKSRSNK